MSLQDRKRLPPKSLTPEQRAEREKEIEAEQANFTSKKFPATQELLDDKPKKLILVSSKFVMAVPDDTEDALDYLGTHEQESTKNLLAGVEARFVDKAVDDGIVRLKIPHSQISHDEILVLLPDAVIDGLTRQVEISIV